MALFDDEFVQLDKVLETTAGSNVHGGWEASMHEFPGTQNDYGDYIQPYERVLPERFVGDAAQEGNTYRLPSSHKGSPRWYHKQYQNAMSIVQEFKKDSHF